MNKKQKLKATKVQGATAKLRKYGLSRLTPKGHLKAGGVIEFDFVPRKASDGVQGIIE